MGNVNRDLQLVLHTQMMCIIVIVFIRCKLYLFEIKTSLHDHIVLMGDATQRSTVGNPAEQGSGRRPFLVYNQGDSTSGCTLQLALHGAWHLKPQ